MADSLGVGKTITNIISHFSSKTQRNINNMIFFFFRKALKIRLDSFPQLYLNNICVEL